MLTIRTLAAVGIGILITSAAGPVFAAPFAPVLDEFWIMKGSAAAGPTEIFRDSFNDNTVPPSGPDGATTYFVWGPGGMTGETGGKLTMTPSLGDPTAITTTYAEMATGGVRLLATSPANANFLGLASSFEMHGLYDMSNLPTISGQSFGIRASDRATGIGNDGNNTYSLFVGVNPNTGDLVVTLRLLDFTTNSSTVIQSVSIQPWLSGADQIELVLSKAPGSDQVSASYALYDYDINDIILRSGSFANTGTIYLGEDYIRAQFEATDLIPVPEPATLALFGLGLVGLFVRRRRTPA